MTSYMDGLKINLEHEKQVLEVLETSGGAEGYQTARLRLRQAAQQGIQVALSSFMARTGSLAPQTHAIISPKKNPSQ